MKEKGIEVTKRTPEKLQLVAQQAQDVFMFNNTMPFTSEYDERMKKDLSPL